MMKRAIIILLLTALLVVGCSSSDAEQPASDQSAEPVVTVFRPPT